MADIGEPHLNCKAFTLTKIKDEHITQAIEFCKEISKPNNNSKKKNKKKLKEKKNDKEKEVMTDVVSECITLRQTEHEIKNSKSGSRLAWNVNHQMMWQRPFYRAIERKVLQTVKKVTSTEELEVKQFTILLSQRGCKKQVHDFDNDPDPRYKRYYIILSLMEGTSFSVKKQDNEGIEHTISLDAKSMVLFNDSCYHAGGAYEQTNYRFYFMVAPKDMPKEGLNANTIKLLHMREVKLCSYCLETTIKSKEVLKNRKRSRAFYEHRIQCKQYWMIEKGMSDDEAEQEALYWIGEKMERNEKSNAKRKEMKEETKEQERKRKHSNTVE